MRRKYVAIWRSGSRLKAATLIGLGLAVAMIGHGQSAGSSSPSPNPPMFDFHPVGKEPDFTAVQPLVDWLPIWGKSAREEGFELPLPFGVGVTYTYLNQNNVVSDVRIAGNPLNVNLRDAKTESHTGVVRGDLWLFPFLNVYGVFGYTAGTTRPAAVFSNGQVLEAKVDYGRASYGGGLTLAGGWKAYFLTLDANWTTGDAVEKDGGRIGDRPLESFTFTPRVGTVFSSGRLGTGSLWVGAMYVAATDEIRGSIDLSGHPLLAAIVGRDSLDLFTKVKPKDAWNLLIGGNWEITKRWSLLAEVGGVFDRFHAIGGVTFRF